MMRNSSKSETYLVEAFEGFLRDVLPGNWGLEQVSRSIVSQSQEYDAILTIVGPDGLRAVTVVEVKRSVKPVQLPGVIGQLQHARKELRREAHDSVSAVLVCDFVSERSRELLRGAGIGWYDLTGNVRVEAERPALFIERTGTERNPFTEPEMRQLRSLKGRGTARVVRALLDGSADTRVRSLAEHAGVGVATSARVLSHLAREQLIERNERGVVQRIHKRSLAQAWARDYGMTKSNHLTAVLAPRGVSWLIEQLAERNLPHVLAGSAALRTYLPENVVAVSTLSLLAVYSDEVSRLKRELRLREVDRGANVLLLEPFDRVVLRGAREVGQHLYTAASQTIVDLLTSPGRGSEEAAQLIESLAAEDEEWNL